LQVNPATQKKRSPLSSLRNRSVVRAFAILKSFYSPDEWVAACELSRRARLHEATVNRFMHTLQDVGAVVRNEDGQYRCVLFVMPGAHGSAFHRRSGMR
jgi:DNA-binding IclR family transcriptional regulator